MDKYDLNNIVYQSVKENPELLGVVIDAATSGSQAAREEVQQRAADMETVAAAAMGLLAGEKRLTKKTKEWFEDLARSKLDAHIDNSCVNWDWAHKEVKG